MKEIKIKYVDFWPNFDVHKDLLYTILVRNGYDVRISETPDYIVYSTFGKEHLNYDCIRIFFAGEEEAPDFNICDYAIGFDHIIFGDRYFRMPLMYQPLYADAYELMMTRGNCEVKRKDKFCSFVYSNPQADPIREQFFNRLSGYKQVNSGGRYKNNIGGPVEDKVKFESEHKFSIAFENVSHPGYHTEKIVQAFAAGGIPIYWGDPKIEQEFNRNAFINVMNFETIDEAIDYIIAVDQDDERYNAILAEKPLLEGSYKELVENEFEKFVLSIFEQDIKAALRTTRTFWNLNYITRARNQEKLYSMMGPVRKLRYLILRLIGKK